MRGRCHWFYKPLRVGRLIPAGAGQICWSTLPPSTSAAHPRGCGADFIIAALLCGYKGSSPRVRGRLKTPEITIHANGLIPAGAGQIGPIRFPTWMSAAHPRGCGADLLADLHKVFCQGSSPRVRGRLPSSMSRNCGAGLIPAGAGQIRPHHLRHSSRAAHPRGCGADLCILLCGGENLGSSPRVRGRLS